MTTHQADFPFEEIRNKDNYENYFDTVAQAEQITGYDRNHIWSVIETSDDEDENVNWITYAPSGHFINVIGYVVTHETHDGETYYEECIELDTYS